MRLYHGSNQQILEIDNYQPMSRSKSSKEEQQNGLCLFLKTETKHVLYPLFMALIL